MSYIKNCYEALDPNLCTLFVNSESKNKLFWKNQEIDYRVRLEGLARHSGLDSLTAIFIMMREALSCQDIQLFTLIMKYIKTMSDDTVPVLNINKLKKYVANEFKA
jgi:hypothetical protein